MKELDCVVLSDGVVIRTIADTFSNKRTVYGIRR